MKRKDYQKPTMRVVKLQHTQMLMTSGVEASRNNYVRGNSSGSSSTVPTEPEVWD